MLDKSKCAEIIKGRFYWVSDSSHPRYVKNSFYFNIDSDLVYEPFFADFGPLNLAKIYKYVTELSKVLADQKYKESVIYHCTSLNNAKRSNAALLCCAFQVLCLTRTADQALAKFKSVQPQFLPFRDALQGPCSYECTIEHCIKGLEYGVKLGWFNLSSFLLQEYQFYQKVENGDLNWIIPKKMVAFSSPSDKDFDPQGNRLCTPKDYIPIFKKFNVTTVVRLNTKTYNAKDFKDAGVAHHDLFFQDGTAPTLDIVNRFIQIAQYQPNALAVHCKAGLGRTGSLIACYAMKHYHFNPAHFIGYIRICRPGSILGPQQHFLIEISKRMYEIGAESAIWLSLRDRLGKSQRQRQRDIQEVTQRMRVVSIGKRKQLMSEFDKQVQKQGDKGQGNRLVNCKLKNQKKDE